MKKWLENNKIFFEVPAALLLSVMAILVGIGQCNSSNEQNELTKSFSTQQIRNQKIADSIQGAFSLRQDSIQSFQLLINKKQLSSANDYNNFQKEFLTKQIKILDMQNHLGMRPLIEAKFVKKYIDLMEEVVALNIKNIGSIPIPSVEIYYAEKCYGVKTLDTYLQMGGWLFYKIDHPLMVGDSIYVPLEKLISNSLLPTYEIWALKYPPERKSDNEELVVAGVFKIKYNHYINSEEYKMKKILLAYQIGFNDSVKSVIYTNDDQMLTWNISKLFKRIESYEKTQD